jgi:proteasome ATPase
VARASRPATPCSSTSARTSRIERIPKAEVEQLVLEQVPDITYEQIGGLKDQVEAIRDAVELPYLHADLFVEHELRPPKGILLYGPPGCGKTMIAKAVANSLAQRVAEKTGRDDVKSYFLNVKGPELLNKYVGETERQIRLIFQRAREKASEGFPVIVFFDEMESLFRTRGSGVSSDVETTVVPQLLAEIDGVESLKDVVVIGASNREDMIDPAILRPGRLDVKIKVERPDADAAKEIFAIYLHENLPLDEEEVQARSGDRRATVAAMVEAVVTKMYAEDEDNRFLEVTYANGEKEVLYFKDFNSGAMIENVVARAKKYAIKRFLDEAEKGLRTEDLLHAIRDEFRENEDLPNTTNPDDWARISGKKGERIVYIRTLISGDAEPGRAIENLNPGSTSSPKEPRGNREVRRHRDRVRHHRRRWRCRHQPVLASSMVVGAYRGPRDVRWDHTDEHPLRDARGYEVDAHEPAPDDELGLANTVLTNGARFYVDHAHPEYSSPECSNARDLVVWDKAGERILEDAAARAPRHPAGASTRPS